jgi:hypothetical protein
MCRHGSKKHNASLLSFRAKSRNLSNADASLKEERSFDFAQDDNAGAGWAADLDYG